MTHPLLAPLRLPVVAAPMFLVTGPEMVIAAARSGIVGAFPTPSCRTAEELDRWMAAIAAGCADAPGLWAANLVTHSTNPRLADDVALVAKHRPPIVITALGSPAPVIEAVHGYGGIVLADERGFVLTGRDIPREGWLEDVPPEDLATTLPGVFAGGDIRSGSMKRVASATGEGASVVSSVHAWLAH